MRVRILGSAAGGGLPQWNCRCANCVAARAGSPDVQARTQSSVAVSAGGGVWFLLNVSADVRQQLAACPELWPPEGSQRGTTIGGCVLTDAEIDHTSGLLQLREGCRFSIFSTPIVRRWLSEYLPIQTILADFADRPWTELPFDDELDLPTADGTRSGLRIRVFETGRDAPRFVPADPVDTAGAVVGLVITDATTGGKLVYAPGVAAISDSLNMAADGAEGILIDGTFWDDDEPIRHGITNRTSRQMGHVPVSGADGSLTWLSRLPVRHRVYVHINNTNPMLNLRNPEYHTVVDSGVCVATDCEEFEIQ